MAGHEQQSDDRDLGEQPSPIHTSQKHCFLPALRLQDLVVGVVALVDHEQDKEGGHAAENEGVAFGQQGGGGQDTGSVGAGQPLGDGRAF